MTLKALTLQKLKSHVGELVQLKGPLFWYESGKWDGKTNHIYLLLAVMDDGNRLGRTVEAVAYLAFHEIKIHLSISVNGIPSQYYVLLLIDGMPRWVRLHEDDAELIQGDLE